MELQGKVGAIRKAWERGGEEGEKMEIEGGENDLKNEEERVGDDPQSTFSSSFLLFLPDI